MRWEVAGRRPGEPSNESRGLVGGGGGQMEAGEATNESSRLVGGGGGQIEAEPTKRPKRRVCVVWGRCCQ